MRCRSMINGDDRFDLVARSVTSETSQYGLADRATALDKRVHALQVRCGDGARVVRHCGAENAGVDECGDFTQKSVLGDHVRRLAQ